LVKYARFSGPGISEILKHYAITSCGVFEKFMVWLIFVFVINVHIVTLATF